MEAIWRIESAKVIAALARVTGDVGVAEDVAQDALEAALRQWPRTGVPNNPGAWLTTVGKRRAIDHLRRQDRLARKLDLLGHELGVMPDTVVEAPHAAVEDDIGDDVLRLVFTTCHPVLSPQAQIALTLRLVGGLTTGEIARAFLVPEATVAQRIVRAKRTLAREHVPFEIPDASERGERLATVLDVIYLIFNEGYAATAGDSWTRPDLCEEALRLGRVLAGLAPRDPEVHGLAALMEFQASRLAARVSGSGDPILLLDQDRSRWDRLLIQRGFAALRRAEELGDQRGPYTLQAAIASCHASARAPGDTDWIRIAALYTALAQTAPSPVVELNRAVAVGMAFGPEPALRMLDELAAEPVLSGYHLLHGARGDLLAKLGHSTEARAEFERAAELTGNTQERAVLLHRAAQTRDE